MSLQWISNRTLTNCVFTLYLARLYLTWLSNHHMCAVVLCSNDFASHLRINSLNSGIKYLCISNTFKLQPNKVSFHSGFGQGYLRESHECIYPKSTRLFMGRNSNGCLVSSLLQNLHCGIISSMWSKNS